jgi:hypothetical protein
MSKHTPLPWTLSDNPHQKECLDILGSGYVVASAWAGGDMDNDYEANAEYIVRAVNSHEDLLEALKELEGEFNQVFTALQEEEKLTFGPLSAGVVGRAVAAIAKAEAP